MTTKQQQVYNSSDVVHPQWLDDAAERMHNVIELRMRGPFPEPIAGFMLGTPARRLLRVIYGGNFRCAWAFFKTGCQEMWRAALPAWLWRWWYRDVIDEVESLARYEGDSDDGDGCDDNGPAKGLH